MNDGSNAPPELPVYLNLDRAVDLRSDTVWADLRGRPLYQLQLADEFEGLQLTTADLQVSDAPIAFCGLDRINLPADADASLSGMPRGVISV